MIFYIRLIYFIMCWTLAADLKVIGYQFILSSKYYHTGGIVSVQVAIQNFCITSCCILFDSLLIIFEYP